MVWLACRKAWICSRLNFSASCTLVVNPPACQPLQAHLVLESHLPFRLILYWTRLSLDKVRQCKILFSLSSGHSIVAVERHSPLKPELNYEISTCLRFRP